MPKLPEFKDWQAPWEKSGTEFSADVAKKFIYDLHKDVEKAGEENSTLKTQNSELQTKVTEAERAKETDAEKAAREQKELQDKLASAGDKDLEIAKLELAIEHGLTKSQASRLQGKTVDELKADAEVLVEDLGLKKDENQEENTGAENNGRQRPRRVTNPLNNGNENQDAGLSVDEILKAVPRI